MTSNITKSSSLQSEAETTVPTHGGPAARGDARLRCRAPNEVAMGRLWSHRRASVWCRRGMVVPLVSPDVYSAQHRAGHVLPLGSGR
jgi:hypothetical protein